MNGFHAYALPSQNAAKNDMDNIPDAFIHRLVHITTQNEAKLISEPNFIIPLGNLFVHESGYTSWTGYEVFVSVEMKLWTIYALDDDQFETWSPVNCNLLNSRTIFNGNKETPKPPELKLAPFWDSLKTLRSSSFEKAVNIVKTSQFKIYEGSIGLFDISRFQVSQALSYSNKAYEIFETKKIRINADSHAGRTALLLAARYSKKRIIKFTFEKQAQSEFDDSQSLISLAIKYNDDTILDLYHDETLAQQTSITSVNAATSLSYGLNREMSKSGTRYHCHTHTLSKGVLLGLKGF